MRRALTALFILIILLPAASFAGVCGDVNADSKLNLLDVSYIINHLYRSGPEPDCGTTYIGVCGDVNGSGSLNLLDVSYIINFLYRGGPALQCPAFSLESLTPAQGAPGAVVTGVINSSIPLADTLILYLGDMALPVVKNESGEFLFCIPMISAGEMTVIVKTKDSLQSNKMYLTILDATPTGLPPGQITTEIITTMNDMNVFTSEAVTWMREMDNITPEDSVEIADKMSICNQLISNLNAEMATWPDSSKAAFDAFLEESGIADLFILEGSGLKSRISNLRASLSANGQYDEFNKYVQLDNFSMFLANIKAGLSISSIAIIVGTGGTATGAGIALGAINLGLSVIKAVIDGYYKTDLYQINVVIQPLSGPTLEVGEKAQVQFMGGFINQSAPEKVTVGLAIESFFFPLKIIGMSTTVLEQLTDKIIQMAGTTTAKSLIDRDPIPLGHLVVVDPKYYSQSFLIAFYQTGFTIKPIMSTILSSLGLNISWPGQASFDLNSSIASFDPETFQLTAVAEGTIPASAFEAYGWACKPVCGDSWWTFVCFGVEWFKFLNTSDIHIPPLTINPSSSGTVTDIDGNVYQTVTIGTQVWMAENLKVTHYRNGEDIPNVTNATTWAGLTTGAYCEYNNDINNVATYGRLYNWYAAVDSRNIAPTGWHVPTDAEWQTLVDYLGGSAVGGGKMKEVGTTHWVTPNTGATNESGFSGLPGGYRLYDGPYFNVGYLAYFWSSTESSSYPAWYRYLYYDHSGVNRYYGGKQFGFSLRCVRDY